MSNLLTIVIPTKNRHFLLDRTLGYYVAANIDANIIIADSSVSELCKENKTICTKYSKDLKIEYFHVHEDTELFKKYSISADMATTKYILTIGDDDFPLKLSIDELMLKLEKDNSIAAIFGERVAIMKVSKESVNDKWIKTYPNYSGISNTSADSLDRIKKLPIPNWQQYQNSIIRTSIFKKSINMVKELNYTQYSEFFFSAMVLIHGTWVKSNLLFAVCHQESKLCKFKDRYLYPYYIGDKGSVFSGISQDSWSKTISFLCDAIGRDLSKIYPEDKDFFSNKIRKIYMSKLFYYFEYSNNLSNFLLNEESFFIRVINNYFRKFGSFYWTIALYDKPGGAKEYFRFAIGLIREVLNGNLIKVRVKSSTNISTKDLLVSIKRVGSLDYEAYILLNKSSRYNKEFTHIFKIWKNNPCPQQLKKV
jgi:glycosyltransferase domain-containing protein